MPATLFEETNILAALHPAGLVALPRRSVPLRRIRPELERIKERIPGPILRAFRACGRGESPWPLFISGPAGCGKSRAGLFLCDWVAADVRWRDAGELAAELADLKNGRILENGRSDTPMALDHYKAEWRNWFALCVVDEIGARRQISDTAYESIKLVLDVREEKPLLLLSNLTLEQIAAVYDDRIASRCAAGTVVMVDAVDQRVERASVERRLTGAV